MIPDAPDISQLGITDQQRQQLIQTLAARMQQQPAAPPTTGRAGDFSSSAAMDLQPAPGSLEDLQARAGTSRQQLGTALQNQQQQYDQTQSQLIQARQQLQDPLFQAQQAEAQELQRYQQRPKPSGGPIRQLLQNFFRGASDSLMRQSGIPTDYDKQQRAMTNLIALSNADAMQGLRQAQTEALQLQDVTLSDGTVVRVPASEAAKIYAVQSRGQLANQKPGSIADQFGAAVGKAIQEGRDPSTDPMVLQIVKAGSMMQKPTADTAASQKTDFMQAISPAIQAGEITGDMYTDVRKLSTAIQNSRAIPAAQKPGLQAYLLASNTPASAGTQTAFKISLEDQNKAVPVYDTKNNNSLTYLSPADINARNAVEPGRYTQPGQITASGKAGYAFDTSTNRTVLTTQSEAQQQGYVAFRPVSESDISKDTHDIKILNDVAAKSNNLISSARALDQNQNQRDMINWAMAQADKDNQFRVGAFGTSIPTGWLNTLLNSYNMSGATQLTKDYVVANLSLREASMGMQRLLTGSARSNESQINALLATLPGLETDSTLAQQKMAAFVQNLEMLRQGLPTLPGISHVQVQDTGITPTGGSTQAPSIPPGLRPYMRGIGSQSPLPAGIMPGQIHYKQGGR